MKERARPSFVGLHSDDFALWGEVSRITREGARLFDLPLVCVEPKRRPNGAHGLCYVDEGRIAILLRERMLMSNGGRWAAKPLPFDGIVATIAHELAHLKHANHGAEFRALEKVFHARLLKEVV